MMTLERFTEHLKQRLEEITGCEVRIQPTQKNNGVKLTSITIMREGRNVAPTTYAEQYFDQFNAGETIEEILDKIIEIDEKYQLDSDFDVSSFTDYERVKDKLRFKLVNTKKNSERLLQMPHKKFLDLSKIYFAEVDSIDGCKGTITITTEHMKFWGINIDELDEIATENTINQEPASIFNLINFVKMKLEELKLRVPDIKTPYLPMFGVTNTSRVYGAAVLLYDALLKDFSNQVEDDLYIIPSSIHELIFIPVKESGRNASDLKYMIHEVNRTQVAEEEILSDNLYFYNRETNQVEII
ncbi:MAG: hypothetical protein IKY94_05405 [Lachnospiraceae bacterium]|nr:hypothetical protein [Lachnospiraceae bacterium]